MTSTLQKLALQSYTHLPASVTPGPGKQLKAVNEAVNSAARDAAEAASSVIDRMRNNGWYGVASSPTGRDSVSSEDDYQASSPAVSKSRSRVKSPSAAHDRGTSDTGDAPAGEGWKIWQGAYDRVKWQSVNDKVKDVAAAVKKKYAGNDGLCGEWEVYI